MTSAAGAAASQRMPACQRPPAPSTARQRPAPPASAQKHPAPPSSTQHRPAYTAQHTPPSPEHPPTHLQHRVVGKQLGLQRGHATVEAAVVHFLHCLADAAGRQEREHVVRWGGTWMGRRHPAALIQPPSSAALPTPTPPSPAQRLISQPALPCPPPPSAAAAAAAAAPHLRTSVALVKETTM